MFVRLVLFDDEAPCQYKYIIVVTLKRRMDCS